MREDVTSSVKELARRVRFLTVAVVVLTVILAGILVFLAGPSLVAKDVLPPAHKSTAACTNPSGTGVRSYVFYNLTTGVLEGGLTMTGNGTAPTSNNSLVNGVHPGVVNITDQPALAQSIFCWYQGGNSGQAPWHVDLATGQILASPQPPAPFPTYLWLDPTIVALIAGGLIAWRLGSRRRKDPPSIES
jgi:hypothetical protein